MFCTKFSLDSSWIYDRQERLGVGGPVIRLILVNPVNEDYSTCERILQRGTVNEYEQ
jgi:hypothetical protein